MIEKSPTRISFNKIRLEFGQKSVQITNKTFVVVFTGKKENKTAARDDSFLNR